MLEYDFRSHEARLQFIEGLRHRYAMCSSDQEGLISNVIYVQMQKICLKREKKIQSSDREMRHSATWLWISNLVFHFCAGKSKRRQLKYSKLVMVLMRHSLLTASETCLRLTDRSKLQAWDLTPEPRGFPVLVSRFFNQFLNIVGQLTAIEHTE